MGPEGGVTPLSETQILAFSDQTKDEERESNSDVVFVAFARVFSGTVKKGQELYVLGPKHEPYSALKKVKMQFFLNRKSYTLIIFLFKEISSNVETLKCDLNPISACMPEESATLPN